MLRQKMWKWHRVIGYVIGLQVLLWTSGGVVMSWFDIETVRGEHNIRVQEPHTLPSAEMLLPISHVLSENVTTVKLGYLLDEPVYNVVYGDESNAIFSAITGEALTPLGEDMATVIAMADFAKVDFTSEAVPETRLIEQTNNEYRGAVPVWQVSMHDDEGTIIYISPTEARVVGRRNNVWRLYDFFWMLHIMDYENRTDFNNILVQIASFIALLFTITGGYLIYFRLVSKKRKRK